MMKFISILFFSLSLLSCIFGKVPDYIKVCSKSQDQSKCFMENFKIVVNYLAKNGEPTYKIPNLHRFVIPKIAMQATKELQVSLNDVEFLGLDKIVVKDFTFSEKELHMVMSLERLDYSGNYDIKGKILILPIEGVGTMHITQFDFVIDYTAKLKAEERKGKKYYYVDNNPQDTKVVIKPLKKVTWQFDNLFGGDPTLGPQMNKFLNENWEDVFNEVKGAFEEAAAYFLVNPIVNGYLRHIPIVELFTD